MPTIVDDVVPPPQKGTVDVAAGGQATPKPQHQSIKAAPSFGASTVTARKYPPAAMTEPQGGNDIVQETFDRLTRGIPKAELRLYIKEALECGAALQRDIEALEQALEQGGSGEKDPAVDEMIMSPFTPLDRYWTASALVGRLRGPMAPPSLFKNNQTRDAAAAAASGQPNKKGNKSGGSGSGAALLTIPAGATWSPEAQRLLELLEHPAYKSPQPTAQILACWKKISSNRSALVFKKPVRDEEAPGYSDRIQFPMDLSLVRKMIVTRHITTFEKLHMQIGLIAHNCVKYNGRETDYGYVAREFEAMADEVIRQAVWNASTAEAGEVSLTPETTADSAPAVAGLKRPPPPPPTTTTTTAPPPLVLSEQEYAGSTKPQT